MPKTAGPGRPTFRITDYTDRELLAIIDRVARESPDDTATAADIADALGVTTNGSKNMTPAKAIGPRLGSMRTVGLVDRRTEKREDEEGLFTANVWFLTEKGKVILGGKVSKSVEKALGSMNAGQQVLVMAQVARSGYGSGDRTEALTLKREMTYQFAQRQVPFRPAKPRTTKAKT